jgi:hypothetical protein
LCSSLTIQYHQGNPPPLLPEFPPAELDVPVPAQPEIPTLQGRIVVLNEFSPTIPPPEVDVPVLIPPTPPSLVGVPVLGLPIPMGGAY